KDLIDKCKPFVIRPHDLNGVSCLSNILWRPETRKFIEANPILRKEFKRATSSRGFKKGKRRLRVDRDGESFRGNTCHRNGRLGKALPGRKQKSSNLAFRIRPGVPGLADRAVSHSANRTEQRHLGYTRIAPSDENRVVNDFRKMFDS